jgi:energy-coupling factor transporter ATP-binding protein EcfA2
MSSASAQRRAIFAPRARPQRPPAQSGQAPLIAEAQGERGFVIARRLAGERVLPCAGPFMVLSPERLCRHVLVCGATGSGKSETLLRLAYAIARSSDAQVFYLDGKGDRLGAQRFCALMASAGRQARLFPTEPFCGWRGCGHEIRARLAEVIDYANEGPAAFYRDVALSVLSLCCTHPEGPPRSSAELRERMSRPALLKAHGGQSAAGSLGSEQIAQVRMRYEAFFSQVRGALEGSWSWDEADCAYLLLDSLALREEAGALSRYLFCDFSQYFTARKERTRLCVLFVDEFSALAARAGMAARLEQARSFHTSIVLAPQVVQGMGSEEEAARIMGSVETVICHRVNTPEAIVSLAGTRKSPELSSELSPQGATGRGSLRIQHQYRVDPNRVRRLAAGEAYVISRGRAARVRVLRAPALQGTPSTILDAPHATEAGRAKESYVAAHEAPRDPDRRAATEELPF